MVEMLYADFYNEILNFSFILSENWQAAEDITQETFIRAMGNTGKISGLSYGKRRSWLYSTAKNIFIDKYRREKKILFQWDTPGENSAIDEDFTEICTEEFLGILELQDREIFKMKYIYGYTSKEIGEIFSVPSGTIRSKLSSARKILRNYLEKDDIL